MGRSTTNPDTGPQPGTIADDLHALVEHLGLDRFHLVGVAGGGFAAYDYVLWHPERVRSMVIAASGGASPTMNCGSSARRRRFLGLRAGPRSFGK
jgi:pimeloyl-ACP methyl ester carboxylesterase